jgi:hypothetical protein
MEATDDRAWTDFAEDHFGDCQFGDERLTQRTVITAAAVMRHPGGTLPAKLRCNELLGFYRLANNPKVTHAKMLECHREQTMRRMNAVAGVVLLISDTTEADFSGLESADDLGPIGNGNCRGLLCHNVLAVDYDHRMVLGLANQVTHKRRRVSKNETMRQKRDHPQRESRLWKRALEDVPAAVAATAAPEQLRVHVCDRGADAFENIEFWENRREKYVIRSKSNRKIVTEDGMERLLHDYARQLKRVGGERTIRVSENHGQPAREARIEIGFARIILPAPRQKRGEHTGEALTTWVVHVREIDPPRGITPLEWILLTNVPVNSASGGEASHEDAWLRVEWYRCRPIVEEFHKAMKTGCGIEQVQFTTRSALEVSLALLSVVATQLVRLRDMSRDERAKDQPASEVIDPIYVEVLSLMLFKRIKPLTTHEFCMALAKLGGHLGRRSDKRPGWLVLWRGWTQLQPMVQAIEADRSRRCA